MDKKIDTVQIASLASLVLTIAGSIVSAWASNKSMSAKVTEEVQKAVRK